MFTRQMDRLSSMISPSDQNVVTDASTTLGQASSEHLEPAGWKSWDWGGKLRRPVPQYWKFPSATVRNVLDIFAFGIPADGIRPLRLVECQDLSRCDASFFCRASDVFSLFLNKAIELNEIQNQGEFSTISIVRWNQVFETCFAAIITDLESSRGKRLLKPGSLSCNSIYNYAKEMEKIKKAASMLLTDLSAEAVDVE